jgi:predicted permease
MPQPLIDLKYAFRTLKKSPGFTLVAVLTLALGVGANTAVFSPINAMLLRPLPYDQPEKLVLVWESAPFFGLRDSPVAPANYVDWKARSRSFDEMGALESHSFRLTGEGTPEVLDGSLVTPSLLRALRIRPALGRIFRDEEDRPGAPKVALIGEACWRNRFGADPNIVGRSVRLSDEKHTIVGVLAAGTEPPAEYGGLPGDVWAPFGSAYTAQQWADRGRHNWMVVARLKPGVPLARANAEIVAIGRNLAREYPDTNEKVGAFVAPMRDHFVDSSKPLLAVLFGTVAFVLLIACANLANLLLARAAARSKEAAVRAALGAGTWRLAGQFLSESLLLSAAGSALGLCLASMTFQFLAHIAPGDVSGFKTLQVDWRVLAFTTGIAALATVVFGLIPVFQLRRLDLSHSLKQGARTLAGAPGSRRLRSLLVCSEVALAFMLLAGAGLLIQTFARVRGVPLGCRTKNVLTLRLQPSATRRDFTQVVTYQQEVLRRVRAVPGVLSAGLTNHIPLVVKGDITAFGAEGRDPKEQFQSRARVASPGYLETMGIPLLRGRDIQETDRQGAPPVILINQALAHMLWPNQDPIGRKVIFGANYQVPVIGVVGDIHQSGLEIPPMPEFHISALQSGFPSSALAIHTAADPGAVAAAVRRAIWSVDPDQPVTDLASMEEILDREVFQRKMQTTLLGAFAGLALLLAAVGLYGVLAYQVGLQIPEIGLRMALGAAPGDMLRAIVANGLGLTAIGLGLGVAGALAVSRLLGVLLFGVTATDPLTYAAVAVVLLATAAAASFLPARRAMRVDPMAALRTE